MVAAEEQDWEEAKRNCREALKIYREFNDRYSQASTFHQLGIVAMEEVDYKSSLKYFVNVLEILAEYKDDYHLKMTIGNLSRLLAVESWDAAKAIEALDTGEETKKVLREMLEEIKKAPADGKGNGRMNDEKEQNSLNPG